MTSQYFITYKVTINHSVTLSDNPLANERIIKEGKMSDEDKQ